jgi:hypothetical protein
MKVRLRARYGLLAGMVALASLGGGCIDENTGTSLDPEGPPYILQVFVLDPTSEDASSPFVFPELVLTYGVHRNINVCPFNVMTGENDGACEAPLTCDTTSSSPTFRHCVMGGKQPISTHAVASTPVIRIVSKELLDGATLEQFACGCRAAGATGCPANGAWSTSFDDCSVCGDAAASAANESGQCLDVNADGVPDLTQLNAGVVELACGTRLPARLNLPGEGYYYPSGNQFPSSTLGWGGLGPAIVHMPSIELPTNTDCTIRVLDVVKDKDGNSFVPNPNHDALAMGGAITFHTEGCEAVETAPADGDEAPVDLASIDIILNVSVDEATAATAVTVTDSAGNPVEGEVTVDGGAISFTPAAELAPGEEYTVTVADTVTDSYGVACGGVEFTFTTEAA